MIPEVDGQGNIIPNKYAGMLFLSWVDPSAKTTNIRLNYVSMDSNYSGKLLPVYGYSFTPEYQGFFTLPIQNQTTGQVKFMDVTDPDNPIELTNGDSKDSLTGQVGDSMVLTIHIYIRIIVS